MFIRNVLCFVCAMLAGLMSAGGALGATTWTDTLSGTDLVIAGTGGGGWSGASLTYTVDFDDTATHKWHYTYVFDSDDTKIRLDIMEAATNFTSGDMFNISPSNPVPTIGMHTEGSGNPNMPAGGIFGIRFGGGRDGHQ